MLFVGIVMLARFTVLDDAVQAATDHAEDRQQNAEYNQRHDAAPPVLADALRFLTPTPQAVLAALSDLVT